MKVSYLFAACLLLSVLLVGCSTEAAKENDLLHDYALAKRIAAKSLTSEQRKEILPWKLETVNPISASNIPSFIQTDDLNPDSLIYKVQFYTSKDEILGPIGVYVDVASQAVVGHQLRN